eukprot:gene5723-4084_t
MKCEYAGPEPLALRSFTSQRKISPFPVQRCLLYGPFYPCLNEINFDWGYALGFGWGCEPFGQISIAPFTLRFVSHEGRGSNMFRAHCIHMSCAIGKSWIPPRAAHFSLDTQPQTKKTTGGERERSKFSLFTLSSSSLIEWDYVSLSLSIFLSLYVSSLYTFVLYSSDASSVYRVSWQEGRTATPTSS